MDRHDQSNTNDYIIVINKIVIDFLAENRIGLLEMLEMSFPPVFL